MSLTHSPFAHPNDIRSRRRIYAGGLLCGLLATACSAGHASLAASGNDLTQAPPSPVTPAVPELQPPADQPGGVEAPAFEPADVAVGPDFVPFASGQVVRILAEAQNGRQITYRTLIVRAGAEPERNLRLVVQKVALAEDRTTYSLAGPQLDVRPTDRDTTLDDVVIADHDQGEAFIYTLRDSQGGVHKCTFDFDGSSAGTPTTSDHFHCDDADHPAAVTATSPDDQLFDGVPLATGRLNRMLSAGQNGRAITYRSFVLRNSDDGEKNVEIVVQKVAQQVEDGQVSNILLDSLVVPPSDLPGGVAAQVDDIGFTPPEDPSDGFLFTVDAGPSRAGCRFEFDGSSAGTPTTKDSFRCDGGTAPK